jgi:hypothetical protein
LKGKKFTFRKSTENASERRDGFKFVPVFLSGRTFELGQILIAYDAAEKNGERNEEYHNFNSN